MSKFGRDTAERARFPNRYAFGAELERRYNARGYLAQFAALGDFSSNAKGLVGKKFRCLKMRRAVHPLVAHANDFVNASSLATQTRARR